MWGAETAKLAGAHLAVNAVEHQYVVTEKSDDIPRDLPTFRDPDARFYLKPEAGALVIGGWEEGTRACWRTIPYDLGPELFKPDHERFAGLAEGAAHRVPRFGELGIRTWVNGPIPFSPDAEPVMGLTEDLDNLFHCCGFSAGIAAAGGAGDAMANWIVDGDPGMDLWPFDVRRFGAPHNVPAVLDMLSVQAYGHYYDIAYPNRPAHPPRGQRRSAVYDRLEARGAVFGGKFGFERANWFAAQRGQQARDADLRPQRGLAVHRRGARGRQAGRRGHRPELVREVPHPGPRRARDAAKGRRGRDGRAGRQGGLHAAAQRTRRHRGGRHRHPARRGRLLPGDRQRLRPARRHVPAPARARRRVGDHRRRQLRATAC